MSDVSDPIHISSLAAPSADDIARWKTLSDDEKRDVIARHIAVADDDIKNGRSTVMNPADDVRIFFKTAWRNTNLELSRRAERDLEKIEFYTVQQFGVGQWQNYAGRLQQGFESLLSFPFLGISDRRLPRGLDMFDAS